VEIGRCVLLVIKQQSPKIDINFPMVKGSDAGRDGKQWCRSISVVSRIDGFGQRRGRVERAEQRAELGGYGCETLSWPRKDRLKHVNLI
jgi:hypothetical protein